MVSKIMVRGLLAAALAAAAVLAQADVFNMGGTQNSDGTWMGLASVSFVTVGNPGNAPDPASGGLYGSVPYTYQMGKYDVTVGQYCQFLNAVAKTSDPYGLYDSYLAPDMPTIAIFCNGRVPTATRSWAATAKPPTVRSLTFLGAMRPASAIGWTTANRPRRRAMGPRRRGPTP